MGLSVVFGMGPLGMAVMEKLHRRGDRVQMVNRRGKADLEGHTGVEVVVGDLSDKNMTHTLC